MERLLTSLRKGLYTFLIGYYNKSKECLKVFKVLLDTLPQFTSYTIGRPYQTHSYNIHSKIIGLVRRLSRRRNMSSSRTHCCHIILNTELKLSCFVV